MLVVEGGELDAQGIIRKSQGGVQGHDSLQIKEMSRGLPRVQASCTIRQIAAQSDISFLGSQLLFLWHADLCFTYLWFSGVFSSFSVAFLSISTCLVIIVTLKEVW